MRKTSRNGQVQLGKKNERGASRMAVNPLRTAETTAGVFRQAAAALSAPELQTPH
jgi:hypothetical protein